jgi:hypothetical protein
LEIERDRRLVTGRRRARVLLQTSLEATVVDPQQHAVVFLLASDCVTLFEASEHRA